MTAPFSSQDIENGLAMLALIWAIPASVMALVAGARLIAARRNKR
jgi:hypothetical protein